MDADIKKTIPARIKDLTPEDSFGVMDVSGKQVFFTRENWELILECRKAGLSNATIAEEKLGVSSGVLTRLLGVIDQIAKEISDKGDPGGKYPDWMHYAAWDWYQAGEYNFGKIMEGQVMQAREGNTTAARFVFNQEGRLKGEPPPQLNRGDDESEDVGDTLARLVSRPPPKQIEGGEGEE